MKFYWILFLLFTSHLAMSQHRCGTEQKMNQAQISDDDYRLNLAQYEELYRQFESGEIELGSRDDLKEFLIPVVVHVLYEDSVNDISSEQVNSQIEVLNRDFNLLNEDQLKIPSVFQDRKGNVAFKFVLADRDPQGNFTNGITRTKTDIKNIGDTESYFKTSEGGISPWPQPHYVNIWVCDIGGLVLGYAYLPAAKMSSRDGIVMSPRAFGTTGTARAPYNMGRTLVHEMGHYFGLRHLWGSESGDCNGTDYMSDTPNQFEENNGCQQFPSFSCTNEPTGDMFMNYMDYGTDSCMLLFTQLQAEFMRLVLRTSRITLQHSKAITGIGESSIQSSINVFPNPANQLVNVHFSAEIPPSLYLVDALGRTVKTWKPKSNDEQFLIDDVPVGIYTIRTNHENLRLVIK